MRAIVFITSLLLQGAPADTLKLSPSRVSALKERTYLESLASPVSIIKADELHQTGTYRPQELSSRIPGLHIPDYGASLTSTIYLRGMGSRMDNPVMGLYVDGIPILDKNAYDYDWAGITRATMLHGPQGTLYGRNSMGGVLSLRTMSPSDGLRPALMLEYGSGNSLRLAASGILGDHALSLSFRHQDGFFTNLYKNAPCDPYNGLSLRWKLEGAAGLVPIQNTLSATVSQEGGFAYGKWENGVQLPVSYNNEGSYGRLSIIDGMNARLRKEALSADLTASLQLLCDRMTMDQDFTPASVFTLQQRQLSGAGTLELRIYPSETESDWKPQTGFFALYKLNHMEAPVHFKRAGIEQLILSNANAHIPSDIGYLAIPDEQFPVTSDFLIGSWNLALFHESIITVGKWQLTAGLRLDYEGARMDFDCLASLRYQFVPTMAEGKSFSIPYAGTRTYGRLVLLPKLSALYRTGNAISLYATVSKGYRAGGFNTQIFSDILQNMTMDGLMKDMGVYLDKPLVSVSADNTEYAPEQAWNFEIGSRISRSSFSAELSAYAIAIRDQQLTVFPPGLSTGRMMANAARSRSLGVEAQMDWKPGHFRSHLSWSWCDARFVVYHDGNNDYAGNSVPYIPRHTLYASAGYSFPLGRCTLETDAFLQGNGPISWNEAGTLAEPFHLRLGGRAALAFSRWEIFLRGENLTRNRGHSFYFKSVGNEFFANEKPRTIMTGISIKF